MYNGKLQSRKLKGNNEQSEKGKKEREKKSAHVLKNPYTPKVAGLCVG